jgi:hypothetical protein
MPTFKLTWPANAGATAAQPTTMAVASATRLMVEIFVLFMRFVSQGRLDSDRRFGRWLLSLFAVINAVTFALNPD